MYIQPFVTSSYDFNTIFLFKPYKNVLLNEQLKRITMVFSSKVRYNINGDMMIKYPNGHRKKVNSRSTKRSTSNRGIALEDDINATNEYYLVHDLAVVHKKPTPIQVVNVHYPDRKMAEITKAFYTKPSTTDYNGVYRGRALDFEAKQTSSTTLFKFSLIHDHQIEHLQRIINHNGIAFVIIRFSSYDETYYVEAQKVIDLYFGKRRSIPYAWFAENAILIPFSLTPPVDYLKVIDRLYFEGDTNGKK